MCYFCYNKESMTQKETIFLLQIFKSKKNKLTLSSSCHLNREIRFDNLGKLICIDQSLFGNFSQPEGFKNV